MASTQVKFGVLLIVLLAVWAIVSAVFIVAGMETSNLTKYWSYATFGAAPLVCALGLWFITRG